MIRRICLFAGPDAGKTTTAYLLSGFLKRARARVEYVPEKAKEYAYEKRLFHTSSDQFLIFAKQKRMEELFLAKGADYVVCDSPISLPIYYAKLYNLKDDIEPMQMAEDIHEKKYPSLNIFLKKERIKELYNQEGRHQTFEGVCTIDKHIYSLLQKKNKPFYEFDAYDAEGIFEFVKKELKI